MSRKKVSTTIYITPEQAERLKLLSDRTKVPIAVYIREGIDLMLKHYEHMLPGQMSLDPTLSIGGIGAIGSSTAALTALGNKPTPSSGGAGA